MPARQDGGHARTRHHRPTWAAALRLKSEPLSNGAAQDLHGFVAGLALDVAFFDTLLAGGGGEAGAEAVPAVLVGVESGRLGTTLHDQGDGPVGQAPFLDMIAAAYLPEQGAGVIFALTTQACKARTGHVSGLEP